jgi:hypothetical protein
MKTIKVVHPVSFMLAALLGITAGACKEGEVRTERVCERHCQAMEDCNNADYDDCLNTCIETASECDSDSDRKMALDKLDECRNEQCGDLVGCGVDAWFECKL